MPPPSPTAEEGKIPLLRWAGGGNCFCNGIWGWDQVYGQPDLKNTVFFYDFPYLGKVLDRAGPVLRLLPLRYMLGLLYTNFTLLWAPLSTLLASYGNGFARDEFWEVVTGGGS